MPSKIRQLIADLEHAGFRFEPGQGSHRKYRHPSGIMAIIFGHTGDDAKHYQEKQVKQKIEETRHHEKE
jgi:predicted RNA binding protein YcfA (HicA-like mRNA interferase family)